MKRIASLFAAAATLLTIGILGSSVPAFAAPGDPVHTSTPGSTICNTLGSNDNCTEDPHGSVGINKVIATLIKLLSFVVGLVAVIMVIVAGFKYVTAAGDSNKVTSAKNTLIYALVGVVIAVMAQIIVQFVLSKF